MSVIGPHSLNMFLKTPQEYNEGIFVKYCVHFHFKAKNALRAALATTVSPSAKQPHRTKYAVTAYFESLYHKTPFGDQTVGSQI
jgi:hypothetical protein